LDKIYNSGVCLYDGTFVLSGLGGLDFLSPSGAVIRTISTPPMSDHIIMAYSPHSHLIAAVSLDQILRVWDLNAEKGKELIAVFGGGILFAWITFSPDGKQIIVGDQSGSLTLLDIVRPIL
jgi:WD40 repeat protein